MWDSSIIHEKREKKQGKEGIFVCVYGRVSFLLAVHWQVVKYWRPRICQVEIGQVYLVTFGFLIFKIVCI